jgi:hypothetical protein
MAGLRKTPRRQLRGGPSSGDRFVRLNFIHRAGFLGQKLIGRGERYLIVPEPDEELEGSELTDGERYQAMMRERTRREGLD